MKFLGISSVVAATILAAPNLVWGCDASYCPGWGSSVANGQISPNHAYLEGFASGPDANKTQLRDKLLPSKRAQKFRREYEDMVREYELRSKYNVATWEEHASHNSQVGGFSNYIFRHIVSYQVSENLKEAERKSEGVRTFQRTYAAVERVAKGSMKVEVSESTKIGSRANFPAKRGRVWMDSPLANASLDMQFGTPFETNPFAGGLDPMRDEQYRLSVNRSLGLGVQSGVTYGGTSTRYRAAVARQVVQNLSVELATTRALDSVRAGLPPQGEQSVNFNYGLSF